MWLHNLLVIACCRFDRWISEDVFVRFLLLLILSANIHYFKIRPKFVEILLFASLNGVSLSHSGLVV